MATDQQSTLADAELEVDPAAGFAYCRELPPDVPPGMTLAEWRRAHHHGHPHRRHLVPRLRPGHHPSRLCPGHHPSRLRLHHHRRPA